MIVALLLQIYSNSAPLEIYVPQGSRAQIVVEDDSNVYDKLIDFEFHDSDDLFAPENNIPGISRPGNIIIRDKRGLPSDDDRPRDNHE